MRLTRLVRHKSTAGLAALVTTLSALAVLHDGTEVRDLDLHDGGVWVTNLAMPGGGAVAAHLNYPSRTLDSYTEPATNDFDVSQEANAVVMHDQQSRGVASIDTATWQTGIPSVVPRGASAVQGGSVLVIADPNKGKVWAVPAASASDFNPDFEPLLDEQPGVRATASRSGVVYTLTTDGALLSFREDGSGGWTRTELGTVTAPGDGDRVSFAVAGTTPVVLDHTRGWVAWPAHEADLANGEEAVLQQSGDGDRHVFVATPDALVTYPLDGSDAEETAVPEGGQPIAPVTVGPCTYAAWMGTGAFVRDCVDDTEDVSETYDQLRRRDVPDSQLVFRVNRDVVVLNDPSNGDIFLVNDDMTLLNDWSNVQAEREEEDKKKSEEKEMRQFRRPEENRPPEARPDQFGVRPGTSVTLPVLSNDVDPDGDVLLASSKTDSVSLGGAEPAALGRVREGRALRIEVPEDASGSGAFQYAATDGRSGDDQASVSLEVRADSENAPPRRIDGRTSELTLVERGSGEHRVVASYLDPDGDPFWVDDVAFPKGLDGVFTPEGRITVEDDGTQGPRKAELKVFLTDGRARTETTTTVTVKPRVQLPPYANADFAKARVGERVEVKPLLNDLDPNDDQLFVSAVGKSTLGRFSGDYSGGSLTFEGRKPGIEYVDYSVSDGPSSADGVIRIDVVADDSSQAGPVPDDDLGVVPVDGEVIVDVLANDTDPLGGVLVVQSVDQPDDGSVTAEVLDHETIRIRDNGLTAGSAKLTYTVANANGSATGAITVVRPKPIPGAVPLAVDDLATVRSGDVVTVDVLDNDISPNRAPLRVRPDVQVVQGGDLGVAWASEDRVRFKADGSSGSVRVQYTIEDPDGNADTGSVDVAISPLSGSNSAPLPPAATARMVEGGTVEIPVPRDGVDPDGDSVVVLGLDEAPSKGVARVTSDVITYTGVDGLVGTDAFTYLVEDRFGAQATGRIKVGIAPRAPYDEAPITVPDVLSVRPERPLSVPVVANDIDPEGEQLALVGGSVVPADEETTTPAETVDGRVELTSPSLAEDGEQTLRYAYEASDPVENATPGELTVEVSQDAPLQPPVARDDVVTTAEIMQGRTDVVVEVLDNDEDPDGAASALELDVQDADVEVLSEGRLRIPVPDQQRVVVYSVTDQDDQVGRATVLVPGARSLTAQRPTLDLEAELPVKAQSGKAVDIPLDEYVLVRPDREPTSPFSENVEAGPGWDGDNLLADEKTLRFRSEPGFAGLTSVTALVSDAESDDDGSALTSTLTFPVLVEDASQPDRNTPPSLRMPEIRVAPGEDAWQRDLRGLASDPDPGDLEKLRFEIVDPPSGVEASLSGSTLSVKAPVEAKAGLARQFDLRISDGTSEPVTVPVLVSVTTSTAPLMTTRAAVFDDTNAGETVTLDVRDYVSNPFESTGGDITLVGAPRLDPGSAGRVSVQGTRISVATAKSFHGTATLTYVVQDATGAAERQVQGQARVVVRAAPESPTSVTAVAVRSKTVEVNWRAGNNNGAPITGYEVRWTGDGGGSRRVGPVTSLTVTGLTNDREYVFYVTAINEAGESKESRPSRPARPDDVPAAPTGLALSFDDGVLHATWKQPSYEGSRVTTYEVFYNGRRVDTGSSATRHDITGLQNGIDYEVKVRGVNRAEVEANGRAGAGSWSGSAREHPNGEPSAPSGVRADGDAPDDDPSALVSWSPGSDNGHAVSDFEVRRTADKRVVRCASAGANRCRVDLRVGQDDAFQVRQKNRSNPQIGRIDGWGPWSGSSNAVRGANPPGAPKNLRAAATGSSGKARVTFDPPDLRGGESVRYRYSISGGSAGSITSGQVLGGFSDGSSRTIRVWALTTANGKESAPGREASAAGNSFSPCTVSVSRKSNNYDNVTFRWSVASHGRSCSYSGSDWDDRAVRSR